MSTVLSCGTQKGGTAQLWCRDLSRRAAAASVRLGCREGHCSSKLCCYWGCVLYLTFGGSCQAFQYSVKNVAEPSCSQKTFALGARRRGGGCVVVVVF